MALCQVTTNLDQYFAAAMRSELPVYPFRRPPELDDPTLRRHPVVIVGAGLTGLTLALDLVRRGHRVVVLDDDNTVGVRGLASRGIVWAQRTLDIFQRLGVAERIAARGVTWNTGRVLCADREVASFQLQPQPDLRFNGFINLQQYHVEQILVETLAGTGGADLRWLNRVESVREDALQGAVELTVETPDGGYRLLADWVVACDGSASQVRSCLGLYPTVHDKTEDRWIIIDIVARNIAIPHERWTWLDCSANAGRAVWRHPMADDTWRLDFQMSPDEDAEAAATETAMRARVGRLLGPGVEFDIAWSGVWQYRHECLESFCHGRVMFAGDAAHVVSPFGARGGNGGIQDADALGWRLALVLSRLARSEMLLDYSRERRQAAMENIRQTRRSARFVFPVDNPSASLWREAIVELAPLRAQVARMINTGRLSAPAVYRLAGCAHGEASPTCAVAGRALPNVRLRSGRIPIFLHDLLGPWFTALDFEEADRALPMNDEWLERLCGEPGSDAWQGGIDRAHLARRVRVREHCDAQGLAALARQLPAEPSGVWLVRPDQHIGAHWTQSAAYERGGAQAVRQSSGA